MKDRTSLDYWRSVFRRTKTSICDIIESAIRVAAADHPDELAARRDRIVEVLDTCRLRHRDRAADEQRESSSGATTRRQRAPTEQRQKQMSQARRARVLSAKNSTRTSIGRKDTGAKRKREDATNESPEPRDVPNKKHKPASGETMKCPQNLNRGQSEVPNTPSSATKAATQQHYDDKSLAEKLEYWRMKFRAAYQAAKKARTIRLEFHEIPKPNNIKKNSNKNRCKRSVSVRFRR